MTQIFILMAILGGFTFLGMGLSIGNSIEAKESEKTANIMTIIMLFGVASFIIGFVGLVVMGIINS
jgi:hypothetical protein